MPGARTRARGQAEVPAPRPRRGGRQPAPRVWKGSADLEPLLVPVGTIHPDPANARTHDARNLATIRGSLARFGQQKPAVVDSDGVIRAGNGQYEAALQLGWTHLAVSRTALEGGEAAAFAVVDNRSSELGSWSEELLVAVLEAELAAPDGDLESLGFTAEEVEAMQAAAAGGPAADGAATGGDEPQTVLPEQWLVVIECGSEAEQVTLLERLQAEGLRCKALVS